MVLKILGISLLSIIAIVLLYLILSFLGALIPVNLKFRNGRGPIEVFLCSDGIHADFIIPSINDLFDWSKLLDISEFQNPISNQSFLGMGWGDKGFYLEIPTWADLTPKIALRAMCVPSPTVMHVTAYTTEDLPSDKKYFQSVFLSEQQYLDLCAYIQSYFWQQDDQIELLPGVGYTENDNFYKANHSYHAFSTCNYWVNRGLKYAGVRTALWSPAAWGLFLHLKKDKKA